MRAWIAFTFGFIHGFGFASVLREMDLPRRALGWSLFSFNIGVEIGQLMVVVLVASAFAVLRARSEWRGRHLAFAGSIVVMRPARSGSCNECSFPGDRHEALASAVAADRGRRAVDGRGRFSGAGR